MRTESVAEEAPDSVRALSVHSILDKASPGAILLIAKIDIEGFERNLFSKNTGWVALFPVAIIESHDRMLPGEGVATNFLRVVAGQDRDFIVIGDNVILIRNASGPAPADARCAV